MRISKLEIFGFKSFKDKVVIDFDCDIIGVVGPNGCGKSNIVDSIKWVLGETRAKQLRGGVQEDLIFAGSASAKPMGMAEVAITFTPGADWKSSVNEEEDVEVTRLEQIPGLFDCSEVQVTRRLYRSGESEYLINKVPVKHRDIQDFTKLIGLGSRGLSIVGQGNVGSFVTKKPIERRELIEEAAGISGFRARIAATELQLKTTTDNLDRLKDLSSELESKVKYLSRQAKKAQNRKALKEELFTHDTLYHQRRIEELKKSTGEFDFELKSFENSLKESDERISSLNKDYENYIAKESELASELDSSLEKRKELYKLAQQKQRLEEEFQERLVSAKNALISLDEQIEKSTNAKEQIEQESQDILSKIDIHNAELVSLNKDRERLNEKLLKVQAKSERVSELELDSVNLLSDISPYLDEVQKNKLKELIEVVSKNEQKLVGKDEVLSDLQNLEGLLRDGELKLREASEELSGVKAKKDALEQSILTIESQIADLEANALEQAGLHSSNDVSIILSKLDVPESLQSAISAVLGKEVNYLLAEDFSQFLDSYENKNSSFGVIDSTILSSSAKKHGGSSLEEVKSICPNAKLLFDEVNMDEDLRSFLNSKYHAPIIVPQKSDAISIRRSLLSKGISSFTIVTESAEVFHSWGFEVISSSGASLSLARNKNERLSQLKEIENSFRNLESRRDDCKKEVDSLRASYQQKLELKKSHEEIEKTLRVSKVSINTIVSIAKKSIVQEERAVQDQVRESEKKISSQEALVKHLEQSLEGLSKRAKLLDDDIASCRYKIKEKRQELSSLEHQANSTQTDDGEIANLNEKIRQIDSTIDVLSEKTKSHRKQVHLKSTELSQVRQIRDSVQTKLSNLRMKQEKTLIEIEHLNEHFEERYSKTLSDVGIVLGLEELSTKELKDKVDKLWRRIEREGEVDPESIQLYEGEKARYDDLCNQIDDLENSCYTLNESINKLRAISQEKFDTTFEKVQQTFSELLPRLYGGGSGKIELIEGDDELSRGIEVSVKPPGKTTKRLDLLSGGEKAIAATAAIMAVFLHSPSPICVLDEVDAPLDDANLSRFLNLIIEISARTCFLMITHNKQSMVAVDKLIGITMQEQGVSTLVEVDLKDTHSLDSYIPKKTGTHN